MTHTDKTLTALQLVAGIQPAWPHWNKFKDEPVPQRDKALHSVQQYQDNLSTIVKRAVCVWLAKRLNADFKPEPDFWVHDSTMDDGPEPVYLSEPGAKESLLELIAGVSPDDAEVLTPQDGVS